MNTNQLFETIPLYLKEIKGLNLCSNTLYMNNLIITKFKDYCLKNNFKKIERKEIEKFYFDIFNLDINNLLNGYDYVKTRPVFALIDYYKNGSVKLSYKYKKNNEFDNIVFKSLIDKYLNNQLSISSLRRKKLVISRLLLYIQNQNIDAINKLSEKNIIDYINNQYNLYNFKTKSCYVSIIKKFLNWLFENKKINFSGNMFFANTHYIGRKVVERTYTEQEIKSIIDSIDNTNFSGKTKLLIISLLAYYGLRAGDIANLKYENIDFVNNRISLIQLKTKITLILPLIDEVKYPLLDYIKNNQYKLDNYIIRTLHAPYRKYTSYGISDLVSNIIKQSNINIDGRKTGSRIFRHSLATTMINNDVSLEKIRAILGHSKKTSTCAYITRDITHLKELTLEMPYEQI